MMDRGLTGVGTEPLGLGGYFMYIYMHRELINHMSAASCYSRSSAWVYY